MDQKGSKIRTILFADDSSSQSQSKNLNPNKKDSPLAGSGSDHDFNSDQDRKKDYEGHSFEEEGDRPMPAVEEYDKEREQFRNSFKEYCQKRASMNENSYSHRSSRDKRNRYPHTKKSREQTREDRDHEEMMDGLRFKRETFPEYIDQKKQKQQFSQKVGDVNITFPFKPYEIQLRYIQKVLKAVESGSNALLESPTGTGKTLCLLSAILSWIGKQKIHSRHRRVVYLSRTHSQLYQVIKQLKNTCFRPTMVHMGSRDHACIKEEIRELKGREKVQACSKGVAIRKKYCRHEYDFTKMTKQEQLELRKTMCNFYEPDRGFMINWGKENYANKVLDLQQMKQQGKMHGFCPYFYPFSMEQYIDVFLMPYNYILDIDLLPRYGNILSGSVLVFDEAHNVADSACQGRSAELFMANLKGAELELTKILFSGKKSKQLAYIAKTNFKLINEILNYLKDMEATFIEYLNTIPFDDSPIQSQKLYKGEKLNTHTQVVKAENTSQAIYELFAGVLPKPQDFKTENGEKMKQKLHRESFNSWKMIQVLIEELKETQDGIFHNLEKVAGFAKRSLKLMIGSKEAEGNWFDTQINHFRLMLHAQPSQTKIGAYDDYRIELRCLVPWLTFDEIQKYSPRSIIFTSGTMSPLESWEIDLKIKAPVRLINSHVISNEQIRLNLVKKSIRGHPFNFGHRALQNTYNTIYDQLMLTLIDLEKRIPNGILVVCPNFKTLFELRRIFSHSSFIRNKFLKKIIFEDRGSDNYVDAFKVESRKGAILVCVCRGRASEGIDFPDHYCRAVIMVGVPYPNVKDPYLIEKEGHFRRLEKEAKINPDIPKINWNQWYINGTIRAVNQALGRVVRHIKDYGMLFLFDERYQEGRLLSKMPKWARQSLYPWQNWQQRRVNQVSSFYRQNKALFPHQDDPIQDQAQNDDTTLIVRDFKPKEPRRFFISERKGENNNTNNNLIESKEKKQKITFSSKPPKGFVGQTNLFDYMKKK